MLLENKVYIPLPGGRGITLSFADIDDIDVQEYLRIDYGNIMGEILTFPFILAQFGVWKSEIQSLLSEKKLAHELLQANLRKKYRRELSSSSEKRVTDSQVESCLYSDPEYSASCKELIEFQFNFDVVESIYWAATDKSRKLDRLSEKLALEVDSDFMDKVINGVMVKYSKNLIT